MFCFSLEKVRGGEHCDFSCVRETGVAGEGAWSVVRRLILHRLLILWGQETGGMACVFVSTRDCGGSFPQEGARQSEANESLEPPGF